MDNIQSQPPFDQTWSRSMAGKQTFVNKISQEHVNSGLDGNVRRGEYADCLSNDKPYLQSPISSINSKSKNADIDQKSESDDQTCSSSVGFVLDSSRGGELASKCNVIMSEGMLMNKTVKNEEENDRSLNHGDNQSKCMLAEGEIKVEVVEYNEGSHGVSPSASFSYNYILEDQYLHESKIKVEVMEYNEDGHAPKFSASPPASLNDDNALEGQNVYPSDTDGLCHAEGKKRKVGLRKRQKKMHSETKQETGIELEGDQLGPTESKTKGSTEKGRLKPRKKYCRKKKKMTGKKNILGGKQYVEDFTIEVKTSEQALTSQGDVTMTEHSTVNANQIIYNEKADSLNNESDSQDKCALAVGDIKVEDEEYNEEDHDIHVTAFDPDSSSEDYAVEDQDLYDSDTDEYEPYCAKRKKRKAGPQKRQKKMVSKSKVKKEMCVESGSEQLSNTESKTKGRTKKGSLKPRKKCTRKKKKMTDGGSGAEEKEEDEEDKMFTVKIKTSEKCICEECGKTVSSKACLKKHMHLHAGTFTCCHCSKSFISQLSLKVHVENHDGVKDNKSTCNVCDKVFCDDNSLNRHVKHVHLNYRPYPCPSCERRFSEKKTLVEHIRTHTGERPFPCELCGKSYKRVSELNFHMKKHTGETKLTCSECGKGFLRHSQLRQHQLLKHTEDKPLFTCSFCGKQFGSNSGLKDHMLTHTAQKDFQCEKCGKGFKRKATLRKHLKNKGDCNKNSTVVNGVNKCKFCLLEIEDHAALQKHVKEEHAGEGGKKVFQCKVCKKEFGRTQSLKRHLKIHDNVRDYMCSSCGATFIQEHHLKQHMRIHTGEKPFPCTICHRSFAQKATLYSHMKHH